MKKWVDEYFQQAFNIRKSSGGVGSEMEEERRAQRQTHDSREKWWLSLVLSFEETEILNSKEVNNTDTFSPETEALQYNPRTRKFYVRGQEPII